ncbi:barwin-like endoglucanase [Sistotremastrum suecicum HHB10207 ss-3]|uniref:Barwin-like endoglucanase n=1 Tax=Sistotremastrum suecicum HHB10207 ss-3 TaxID=1314776 RepID=A0A166GUR6_9AGAM|nr:barwin-like endoglucanase [Sistotremastrum suecicum HHB10207 ss-3]
MFASLPLVSFLLATVALPFAQALAVPRSPEPSEPADWGKFNLEDYDTYHCRYMALDCEYKHNTAFFNTCCTPLSAGQSLSSRPEECNPDPTGENGTCDCDDGEDEPSSNPPANIENDPTTPAPSSTPTPTTHSSTKAPTTTASSPSSSQNTGGVATFFYQNGVAGACGTVHQDSDFIAAIDQDRYGNSGNASPLCGKQVRITNTNNQKSVTVTIADDCPTCINSNSIDLSVGAFTQIATEEEGEVPIKWQFV